MNPEMISKLKKDIIAIGHLLWDKELVSGLNGNISVRVDDATVLLTATGSCLGLLQEKDVLLMTLDGTVLEDGRVSTEKLLHTEIYRNFSESKAVIHTHTTFTNAYFINNASLDPQIFESKFYLGTVQGIAQSTPSVTDAGPVIDGLQSNNIVALRRHGVVAMGRELFDCFLLIQALEDAVKVNAFSRLLDANEAAPKQAGVKTPASTAATGSVVARAEDRKSFEPKRYQLFSREQIDAIVANVNADEQMKVLGAKTNMTMDLAVKLDETGEVFRFSFEQGRIKETACDENAEFVINAPEKIWRAVFNKEIDPFVATTQKKMTLKGDFGKISKWYAPCSRLFELWERVPVE